ncbi:hypothetical protein XELAEV_18016990mg [Xenopus laevis]|uniref:Uncharacterized protein n=1 Tax=Xenopus laevis TaxID=8355 RepID=A0A974DBL1_XENLA|nr:hypothetical protein XELAEV_18016990mg [Xenopus laevis]
MTHVLLLTTHICAFRHARLPLHFVTSDFHNSRLMLGLWEFLRPTAPLEVEPLGTVLQFLTTHHLEQFLFQRRDSFLLQLIGLLNKLLP